jgi:hypothetical protein
MTAALKYLSRMTRRMTDEVFEAKMQREAKKICKRQNLFNRRAA